jgi:hypothetical protein
MKPIRHQISSCLLWVAVLSLSVSLCTTPLMAKAIRASADPVKDELPLTEEDRDHWAFKPLHKPEPPVVQHDALVRNEIDRFILAKLEAQGQMLSPAADPATLIRRATYDLIGLPPTPQEVHDFVRATRAYEEGKMKEASSLTREPYEVLVEQLLNSPLYGEKSAQSWLDLARFAESDGFEHDLERRQAWQYRDWVIQSLNNDLPYDDFVSLQLAGDEISPQQAAATGFLLSGPDMPDTNFQDERRHLLLNDVTSTVGSAFLGLTLGCAQCHDHPYDPVSQADFYRLRAFFDNMPPLKKDQQIGRILVEVGRTPRTSKVCIRGDYQKPGPTVQPAFLRISNPAEIEVTAAPVASSSGRRTALARWMTQPSNGLFLRTSVNRLWQHHFGGRPLAATPGDLGRQGAAPSHVELIDWLATELPLRRWSLKSMHKLIMLSATYRQAGRVGDRPISTLKSFDQFLADEKDPSNTLLSHFPRHRLTGEELRDAMLFVSGRLNFKASGPSVKWPLPTEIINGPSRKKNELRAYDPEQDRRSIYGFAQRNQRFPMFDLFDRPDALLSCSRRNESTTATQALTLFNSEFSYGVARSLAMEVMKEGSDAETIVNGVTLRCCGRTPEAEELALGRAFLEKQTALTPTLEEAVTDYCLALLNSSAFCYVD